VDWRVVSSSHLKMGNDSSNRGPGLALAGSAVAMLPTRREASVTPSTAVQGLLVSGERPAALSFLQAQHRSLNAAVPLTGACVCSDQPPLRCGGRLDRPHCRVKVCPIAQPRRLRERKDREPVAVPAARWTWRGV
jgi:hypothetical protein